MEGNAGSRLHFAMQDNTADQFGSLRTTPIRIQQQSPFPLQTPVQDGGRFDYSNPREAGSQRVWFEKTTQSWPIQQGQDKDQSVYLKPVAPIMADCLDFVPATATTDQCFQKDSGRSARNILAEQLAVAKNVSGSSFLGSRILTTGEHQSASGDNKHSVKHVKLTPVTMTARVKPQARSSQPLSNSINDARVSRNQQTPATVSSASISLTDQQQQLAEHSLRPNGHDDSASSSQSQRATLCLQKTSDASRDGNMFVALMDQHVPCLIARNESGYFVIGSLSAEGDRQPQTASCAQGQLVVGDGHSPSSEVPSFFHSYTSTDAQTETYTDLCEDMNPAFPGGSAVRGNRSTFCSSNIQTCYGSARGGIIKKVPFRGSFTPDSTVPDRPHSVPATAASHETASLCLDQKKVEEHETPSRPITVCRAALVRQLNTEKRESVVQSSKKRDDDLIFLGGHFWQLREPAHPTHSSSVGNVQSRVKGSGAHACDTSTVSTMSADTKVDTEGGIGVLSSASSSCIIVSDEEDTVSTTSVVKSDTSLGEKNCFPGSNQASVIQSSTSAKKYCPTPYVDKHMSGGNNQLKDNRLPEQSYFQHSDVLITSHGLEDRMDGSNNELGLVSRQAKFVLTQDSAPSAVTQDHLQPSSEELALTEEHLQPICRVVSTMSLRMDKAGSQPSEAKSVRKLSAEAFYCCGCAEGTCGFQSLTSAELLMHLIGTHQHEATFPCVHCGDKLPACDALVQHMDEHLGIAALSLYCTVSSCDFNSNSPTTVAQHIATIHPASTSQTCWRCCKTFASVQAFRVHIARNTLQIALCPHCSAKHTDRQNILQHIITAHQNRGRFVAFHEMLLCQERSLAGWWEVRGNSKPCTTGGMEANSKGLYYYLSSSRSVLPKCVDVETDRAETSTTLSAKDRKGHSEFATVISPASSIKTKSQNMDKMSNGPSSVGAVEIVLSSEESGDESWYASPDTEGESLLKLRQQWNNGSLSSDPVIEVDRAESPNDLGLFPWECQLASSCTPASMANTTSDLAESSCVLFNGSSHGLSAEINTAGSTITNQCKGSQINQHVKAGSGSGILQNTICQGATCARKRSFSGETAMTRAIKFHESRSQRKSKRKKSNRRSSLQYFYTAYKQGVRMVYKCLCCEYSTLCPVKSKKGYVQVYNHIHREHTPYTFKCPVAGCTYQKVFRNDVARHLEKRHSLDASDSLVDQIFQVPKHHAETGLAVSPSTETTETSAAENALPKFTSCETSSGLHLPKSKTAEKWKTKAPKKKAVARPRDLYTVTHQSPHARVLQCLCCSYSISQSRKIKTSQMTMHVWQHMQQRFQCSYCGYRAYPSFRVKKHIQHCHPGMDVDVEDLESDTEWHPSSEW